MRAAIALLLLAVLEWPARAQSQSPSPAPAGPSPGAAQGLADCRALLALEDQERANASGLATTCAELQRANTDLAAKNAELERLTGQRAAEAQKSLDLALASKVELEKTVTDLQAKLEACIEDDATPWYGRWELWVGAAAGLAAGLTIGFVAGEL